MFELNNITVCINRSNAFITCNQMDIIVELNTRAHVIEGIYSMQDLSF